MFQAWAQNTAKIAKAHSTPSMIAGKQADEGRHRDRLEAQHRQHDCRMSRIGIKIFSAKRLLAASVA